MRVRTSALTSLAILAGCVAALGCSSSTSEIVDASMIVVDTPPDSPGEPDARPLTADEITLRNALGIPLDAEHVIIFGQNSPLDNDWQQTFDGYYQSFVGAIFTQARQLMDAQPRAFYSICEMAFLQNHIAMHPEELAPLQAAATRGQLHIVGGGMTSPDTTLPETELLVRDYLYGEAFAEDNFGLRPTAAYLPDSFGHGAGAPDLLVAAGYSSVAFSRIDGASTVYFQLIFPDRPLTPGSTAATLQELGSADFMWQGSGGAQILAHFMAAPGFYCQGDNIDYDEELETPGAHTGTFMGDDTAFTDSQIDLYATDLEAWTPTPYMFVPVGCDFQYPKDQLIAYLDGYNQRRYPTTHVWAVAAPFDDFTTFIGYYKDKLPTVTNELTPYFMGFYGTRADVKRATRDAARPFFTAEPFAAILGDAGQALFTAAAPELELLTRADHHDFVTGTATDTVAADEQLPLLTAAQTAGQTELTGVAAAISARIPLTTGTVARYLAFNASSVTRSEVVDLTLPDGVGPVHSDVAIQPAIGAIHVALADMPPFSWRAIDFLPGAPVDVPSPQVTLQLLDASGNPTTAGSATQVILSNANVRAQLDAVGGVFALTSLVIDGHEAMAAPSFMVTDYTDTGGLWRLGNEMMGCEFTPLTPAPETETVSVLDQSALEIRVAFQSASATRELRLAAGEDGLDVAITTGAATMTTRTVSFDFMVDATDSLSTSVPAGWAVRPLQRGYTPTFWPAVGWAAVGGWAILLAPVDRRADELARRGRAVRGPQRAAREVRHRGGTGNDNGTHRIEWRIEPVTGGSDAIERASQAFDRPIDLEPVTLTQATTTDLPAPESILSIDGPGVISAFKPAERGGGLILRVLLFGGPATVHLPASLAGEQVTRVDATEHDLTPIGAAAATLVLDPAVYGSIASVRIQ